MRSRSEVSRQPHKLKVGASSSLRNHCNKDYIMIKKFLIAGLISVFTATSAFAFYDKPLSDGWKVIGDVGNKETNPGCALNLSYTDGSKFQLVRDLKDGEVYFWLKNTDWNIADEFGKTYPVRINFYDNHGNVTGGDFEYLLVTKNTIVIRNLNVDEIIPVFMSMSKMKFIMEGNIQNLEVPLDGTTEGVKYLGECIKQYFDNPPKTETPDVPDSLKQNI